MDERKFIIWDSEDGLPRRDEDGAIVSDGLIGRVDIENAYIGLYPEFRDKDDPDATGHVSLMRAKHDKRPADLEVGECIRLVKYSLSGSWGLYDIYRVE